MMADTCRPTLFLQHQLVTFRIRPSNFPKECVIDSLALASPRGRRILPVAVRLCIGLGCLVQDIGVLIFWVSWTLGCTPSAPSPKFFWVRACPCGLVHVHSRSNSMQAEAFVGFCILKVRFFGCRGLGYGAALWFMT